MLNTTRANPVGERAPVATDTATGAVSSSKPSRPYSIYRYISKVKVYATGNPQPDRAEEYAA
ncbi:hypothetical protein N018_12490 [Pseudomonas syringae CC1557]|uniref:Uncharacterized protein n=1 Tax=Pseudomonas syringae CC1557 TaxID=1357279 RepID=W0N2S6_PSESX|nr:hypothetical protein [Pseudomonas syringae]AHG43588.1 hypothetical protein N018_12490 [Pseudomonas syringae CC1557]